MLDQFIDIRRGAHIPYRSSFIDCTYQMDQLSSMWMAQWNKPIAPSVVREQKMNETTLRRENQAGGVPYVNDRE